MLYECNDSLPSRKGSESGVEEGVGGRSVDGREEKRRGAFSVNGRE